MTRTVDEAYWRDYFRTHNEGRFEDLVTGFYAGDAVFANPRVQLRGWDQILDFFNARTRTFTSICSQAASSFRPASAPLNSMP